MSIAQPRYSLVKKLTRQNLTILLGSMLLSFVLIATVLWLTARQRQGDAAELAAIQLGNNIAAMLVFNDPTEAERELALLADRRELSGIALYDAKGKLFASVKDLTVLAWSQPTLETAPELTPQRTYNGLAIELTIPIQVKGQLEGVLYVKETLHKLLGWFLRGLVIMSALMMLIYLAAARLLVRIQRQALQPLVELSALAERIAAERNFSLRAPLVDNNEIGSLTLRFNELLKRAEIWQSELNSQLQQQAERGDELEILALTDSLTQLPNRLYFGQLLQNMVSNSANSQQMSALMFIDLDNFKFVNDNYGHDAGDEVLIEISRRIQSCIRSDDTLCRLGGDEFALLLPKKITPQLIEQICLRLLQKVREPLWVKSAQMPVSLSIGVAFCPDHSADTATLLQQADEAMYRTKRAGKNGYQIYSAI